MPKQLEPKPRKDWSKPTLKLDIDYLLAGRGMAFRVTGLILTLMSALLVGVVFPGSSVWILCLLAALPLSLLYALVSNRGATLVLAVLLTCYWVTVGEVVNGATLRSSPVVIGILVFCVSFAPLAWYAFVKIPR